MFSLRGQTLNEIQGKMGQTINIIVRNIVANPFSKAQNLQKSGSEKDQLTYMSKCFAPHRAGDETANVDKKPHRMEINKPHFQEGKKSASAPLERAKIQSYPFTYVHVMKTYNTSILDKPSPIFYTGVGGLSACFHVQYIPVHI